MADSASVWPARLPAAPVFACCHACVWMYNTVPCRAIVSPALSTTDWSACRRGTLFKWSDNVPLTSGATITLRFLHFRRALQYPDHRYIINHQRHRRFFFSSPRPATATAEVATGLSFASCWLPLRDQTQLAGSHPALASRVNVSAVSCRIRQPPGKNVVASYTPPLTGVILNKSQPQRRVASSAAVAPLCQWRDLAAILDG